MLARRIRIRVARRSGDVLGLSPSRRVPGPPCPPATITRQDDVPSVTSAVLPITATSIRLFLHVLAATVWVGGQLTLAGLVPGLRAISTKTPRIAARSFNRIAWPAFAVLVATGIWNIADVNPTWDSEYGRTLILKGSVVALSGLAALAHAHSRSRTLLAVFGALTAVSAVGALFLGILLAG